MPVDVIHLLPLPLILTLAALLGLAVLYDLRTFKRHKKKEDAIYRCASCRRVYTTPRQTPLARCPVCGKQNPAARPR